MISRRAFVNHFGATLIANICSSASYAETTGESAPGTAVPELSNAEKILFNTIRLVGNTPKGPILGTGFIFALFAGPERIYPVVVTNKHVVEPMNSCTFLFHKQLTPSRPDYLGTLPVTITDIQERWIPHGSQDLAVIPIDNYINDLQNKGTPPFLVEMKRSNIPTDAELNALSPVEEVLTVGYPGGSSDTLHNLPIFHSGHTATPPYLTFESSVKDNEHGERVYRNDKTFLIDFTTWFGASGSPVFVYNTLGFVDRVGAMHPFVQRIMLIGIVDGLVSQPVSGAITLNITPNPIQGTQTIDIPANVGLCLSSSSILDFEQILLERGVTPAWKYDTGGR